MAKKRKRQILGAAAAIRPLRVGGYPKRTDAGWVLIGYRNNKEFVVGRGRRNNCTPIRPGAPGSWIDNKRCSYYFKIAGARGKGKWYSCRGYGEGVAVACRRMKKPPR